MTLPAPIENTPRRRIKAVDGMAVTADIWDEAHDFHRQHLELHALLAHGPGIASGLNVIASDPPDTTVYVMPGIAIDPAGRLIMLTEPLTYDVGGVLEGRLFLLLTYGESRPRPVNGSVVQEGAPLYVHSEFSLEAVSSPPAGPHVELARLRRAGRTAPITDARDPAAAVANEIDLRYRRAVNASVAPPASLAVVPLGGASEAHARGAHFLARALRGEARRPVWVDEAASLAAGLEGCTLACLTASGAFSLSTDEMNALYAFVQGGGALLLESCRRDEKAAAAADASFKELLQSLGIKLSPVGPGHSLLSEPALFASLPDGYETSGAPQVQAGDGVVLSLADYGCLWQGERRGRPATREEIRAAHEFGGNLVAWAEARQRRAQRSG